MKCTKCGADAELRVDQERDDYVGTLHCSGCDSTVRVYGVSFQDVVSELEIMQRGG